MVTRRQTLFGLAAVTGSAVAPVRAQASYPAGLSAVRIVVPFAPGGASDLIGRLLAEGMTRRWSVATQIEHAPGGSATVGMGRVANGPKDGSQMLLLPLSYVTTQFIMAQLPYDPERDLLPLVQLTQQPSLLCVKKDLPVTSVAELIAYAKANPGKLNYASSGVGSPLHLAAELFKRMTGTDIVHVPFAGSAPSQNALAGGHVDLLFDNAAAIIGLARSGAVKPLAITSATRSRLAPEFEPIADTVPGYAAAGWFGLAVSAGTPTAIRDAITQTSLAVLREENTIQRLAAAVSEPVGTTAADFAAFLTNERARWGTLIRDLAIKI